jgi:lipopolysaccharide biosynthesis glycosyltransferase
MNSNRPIISVVTTLDADYLQHCAVMLSSLITNNPVYSFHVYIIINFADNADLQRLEKFITASKNTLEVIRVNDGQINNFQTVHHITTATYYRLLIPDLVPAGLSRILYLDADLIVKKDIYSLWNTTLDNYSIAAVIEPLFNRHDALKIPYGTDYFNAGVMLINLEKWRSEQLSQKLIDYINQNNGSLEMLEQDALNALLFNQWLPLPIYWNVSTLYFVSTAGNLGMSEHELQEILQQPGIIHYTGSSKPWHYLNKHPLKKEYYQYLRLTPWKNFKHPEETVWHQMKQSVKKIFNIIYGRNKFEVYN